jgi:hypothetical protein
MYHGLSPRVQTIQSRPEPKVTLGCTQVRVFQNTWVGGLRWQKPRSLKRAKSRSTGWRPSKNWNGVHRAGALWKGKAKNQTMLDCQAQMHTLVTLIYKMCYVKAVEFHINRTLFLHRFSFINRKGIGPRNVCSL